MAGSTARNAAPYSYSTSPLPSGTVIISGGETTNSYDANMFVAIRVLNSSHGGSSTTVTYSDTGARFAGAWWIVRGASATQPSGTPSINSAWANTRDAGPVTVANNSMVVVSCCWRRSTSPTITATPAGYTEIARIDGNQQGAWIGYKTVSAGTENPSTVSLSDLASMVISTVGIAPL